AQRHDGRLGLRPGGRGRAGWPRQPGRRDAERDGRGLVPLGRRRAVHDPAQQQRPGWNQSDRPAGPDRHASRLHPAVPDRRECEGNAGQHVVLTALISTTTTVSPVMTSPVSGQSVQLTATVTPGTGAGKPTGSVDFKNGTVDLGSATLSGGTATLTTTKLTAG